MLRLKGTPTAAVAATLSPLEMIGGGHYDQPIFHIVVFVKDKFRQALAPRPFARAALVAI
jgi:hypothetical protein